MGSKINTPIGASFNRLKVIGEGKRKGKVYYYLCECSCGTIKYINGARLRNGVIKSCGCLRNEIASKTSKTHGSSNSTEYSSWKAMKSRCFGVNTNQYKDYGGRGIKICKRWLGKNGFKMFLLDMGTRPSYEYSLDRYPNVNGDYKPSNCRWATEEQQKRNKRTNHWVEYKGQKMVLQDLAKILGLKPRTLHSRFKRMPLERVLKNEAVRAVRKLNTKEIIAIFKSTKNIKDISKIYNICISSISNIKNGKTYLNITNKINKN